jgi:hypothetical protein
MYTRNVITALDVAQIAYPIGPNKDAYYLESYFRQNVETGAIEVSNQVYKNWYGNKKEHLFSGSAKECLVFIAGIVASEGEWIRDEKHDYVFHPPVYSQE